MDTQGSVIMKVESKDSKLEQMCPPRKRKCFREFLEKQDLKSEAKVENSILNKQTDFGDGASESCYLARLLHRSKSPNEAVEHYDKIRDSCTAGEGFTPKANRVTNNNAWESFLREMYRTNMKEQGTPDQLLNLYVKPTEDPMKYLTREMVGDQRPSSNRLSNKSDSVDSIVNTSVREKLHGDSYCSNSRTSTALVHSKPASTQQREAIRSNNIHKSMPPLIHTTYLSENMAPRNHCKDTKSAFLNRSNRGDALDLSLPKMKYSLENDIHKEFYSRQDLNIEYNENYMSPKAKYVSKGDIPQPHLSQTPPCPPKFTEHENHNTPPKYHENFGWSRNGDKQEETCICMKDQCDKCCCCRPTSDRPMYQKNINHKEDQKKCNSTGVSEQVRMTLSSFLQNSTKAMDQQNTQQQTRKYSRMEEGNTGQVSLASMAEYFIEVALKRANKEKQF